MTFVPLEDIGVGDQRHTIEEVNHLANEALWLDEVDFVERWDC